MKFLIQTINNKIVHDFSFALEESVRYRNWYYGSEDDLIIHTDLETPEYHDGFVPVGSVEFVEYYLNSYFNKEDVWLWY